MMSDRSPAYRGRGGTVGGGGNCAVDTEVSKQCNVYIRWKETMVGSSKVVVGHNNKRGFSPRFCILNKNVPTW